MSAFPAPPPPPNPRRRQHRRSITSNSSMSDDEDAITPAPVAVNPADANHTDAAREFMARPLNVRQHPAPANHDDGWREHTPHFDPMDGGDVDTERLWRRMLAIQRLFGCYNSARMSAALSADEEEVGRLRPSKTCLDLLNDSILQLPEEAKYQLEKYLFGGTKRKRASWRRLARHGPE